MRPTATITSLLVFFFAFHSSTAQAAEDSDLQLYCGPSVRQELGEKAYFSVAEIARLPKKLQMQCMPRITEQYCGAFLGSIFTVERLVEDGLASIENIRGPSPYMQCAEEAYSAFTSEAAAPVKKFALAKSVAEIGAYFAPFGEKKLLAKFRTYAKAHKGNGRIESFCRQFADDEKKAEEYFRYFNHASVLFHEARWQFYENYDLTEDQISAVSEYTGGYYGEINSALREGRKLTSKQKVYFDALMSALDKFPTFEGKVMHFAMLPREVVNTYKVGAVVEHKGFTSTTMDLNNPKFRHRPQHILVVAKKNGKRIDMFSSFGNEREVLFKAGTRFRVLESKSSTRDIFSEDIVLEEIVEDPK